MIKSYGDLDRGVLESVNLVLFNGFRECRSDVEAISPDGSKIIYTIYTQRTVEGIVLMDIRELKI